MKPSPGFEPIRGELVQLRPRSPELLREFYAKRLKENVLMWSEVWPPDPSFEEARLQFQEQERSPREWRLWIFTHQGKLIGEASLVDIDRLAKKAEFSIVLVDENYWGRGFGSEAARLFLADAFTRFGLELIYLFTSVENVRAIGAFQKLGFEKKERLKFEGKGFVRMELGREGFPQTMQCS